MTVEKPMTQSDANKIVGRIIAEEAVRYGKGVGMNDEQIADYGEILKNSVYASLYHRERSGVSEPVLYFEGKGYVPKDKLDLYDKSIMELPKNYGLGAMPLPSGGGGFFGSIGSVLSGVGSVFTSIVNVIPPSLLASIVATGGAMLAQRYLGPKDRGGATETAPAPQPVYAQPSLPPGYTVGPGGQAIPPGYTVGAGGQIVPVASKSAFSEPSVIIPVAIGGVLLLALIIRR